MDTSNSRPGFPGFNSHFCRKNFSIWTSLDSTRINAGATSGNSNKSDNEIQELDVVGNISEEETEEEIPGGGIPESAETRCQF